jgi:predicted O-linked N-acetylglucosamine transferase (SPINDLY family)
LSLEEARAQLRAGEPGPAAALLEAHLRRNPDDAEGHFLLALALEDLDRFDEALYEYERTLAAAPNSADALHNRGLLLFRAGRLDEAERNYSDYLQRHPDSARARNSLIDVLLARGQFKDALNAAGDYETALVRKGVALACLRRFPEAQDSFALARQSDPAEVARYLHRIAPGTSIGVALSPQNIYLWRQYVAQGECDWTDWQSFVAEMRKLADQPQVALEPAVAFMALHLPLTADERLAIARGIAAGIEAQSPIMPSPPPRRRARLRIGVLSPDFREHLNAYCMLPLFELLDRTRFELHVYSLTPDDGSAIRAKLAATADRFVELHDQTDQAAAMQIRRDDVDVLVDLAGHTSGGRFAITAQRPARSQVVYLGFAGSLGSKRVDCAIVDRTVGRSPEQWAERLIHLPATYYLYDFRNSVAELNLSRREYSLPNGFVYCAFHKAEKITPDAFDLWMDILSRVPESVLWFLALPPEARRNLRERAAAGGIEPSRLVFAPFDSRERYLARHKLGDLMLDAIHHSAMTTACDALGAGLPVLTLRGSAMASLAGESLLRAAGLPELVAPSRQTFVTQAVSLASDPARLQEYRRRLELRAAPLFDTPGRVRELEDAFLEALAR